MAEMLQQILGTVVLRPYFAAFLLAYFLACSLHLGLRRAFLFAFSGYAIAWLSEFASIHIGIPYGLYYYIETTRGTELWVGGVPFMDSMSFVFLAYAAYSTALTAMSPVIPKRGFYLLETREIRHSLRVRSLGALLFVYLDIIIDPVSLKGSKWFLGQIYGYPGGGSYFGVPISNFVGWFVVGFLLIYALQTIDRLLWRGGNREALGQAVTSRYMLGPALYGSIMIFNLSVAFAIGEYNILWAGIFIVLLPLALFIPLMTRLPKGMSREEAITAHLHDFPGAVVPGRAAQPQSAPFGA